MKKISSERSLSIKSLKIVLSILLVFALSFQMLVGLTNTAVEAKTVTAQKAVYIALGDSVPAGYGLSDTKDGYVQQFSEKMEENAYANTVYNYAISGYTTDNLLSQLKKMKSTKSKAYKNIQKADVITLNIGGNNILGPFIKIVNEELAQKFEDLGIKKITEASSSQLLKIGYALYSMTLNETQLEEIQKGAKDFEHDFPIIIDWLKKNAPSANIIISTVYNPIPEYLDFYKTAETLLKEINSVITADAKKKGYYIADVYTAIASAQKEGTQVLNLNLGQYSTPFSIDIHPNKEGHELIAEVHAAAFLTIPVVPKTKK